MKLAFILVLWVDLKTHQPNLAPRVPPRLFTMENPVMATLEPFPTAGAGRIYRWPETRWRTEEFDEDSLDRRLMRGRLELSPNLNLPERVAMFDGFFSLWFPMFDGIGAMLLRQDGGLNEELADFLAITHTTSTNAFGEWPRRESAHPWITAGQRPRFTSTAEALQQVANGWWDAEREVFLGTEWRGKISAGEDRNARVEDVEFGTQQVRFDVVAEGDTMAVIAQFHHRWWEATVDGQAVEVMPANLGFQAVAVPAGRHRVELRYVDRWFRYGAAMTLLTLLLLSGLAWHWRKAMKGPVPPR